MSAGVGVFEAQGGYGSFDGVEKGQEVRRSDRKVWGAWDGFGFERELSWFFLCPKYYFHDLSFSRPGEG